VLSISLSANRLPPTSFLAKFRRPRRSGSWSLHRPQDFSGRHCHRSWSGLHSGLETARWRRGTMVPHARAPGRALGASGSVVRPECIAHLRMCARGSANNVPIELEPTEAWRGRVGDLLGSGVIPADEFEDDGPADRHSSLHRGRALELERKRGREYTVKPDRPSTTGQKMPVAGSGGASGRGTLRQATTRKSVPPPRWTMHRKYTRPELESRLREGGTAAERKKRWAVKFRCSDKHQSSQ
jgi:hypothetical protein